ncbi:transcription factor [Thermogladius sp. 4427co]|uniref:transcription factor n=1 Tax=Thermogladius sp. 4427co TaxID=3450718 RepID=UPI003F79D23D
MMGEEGKRVLEFMLSNNDLIIEETAGKDLNIKSNIIRKILQKLSDEAVVIPVRVRDEDKALHGWVLNRDGLNNFVVTRLRKAREKLMTRIRELEENSFFVCPSCSRRFRYDEALANDFHCPNDNSLLVEVDRESEIRVLSEKVKLIDRLLEYVSSES